MKRVLIVDDNPGIREALSLLFEIEGIPVCGAAGPNQALERMRRNDIGLVIQDMNFSRDATSGSEGERLFHAIRAEHPRMPVLLITAWTSLETAVKLVKQGAQDYLAKPWDDDTLIGTVRQLLAPQSAEPLPDDHGLVYASEAMTQVVRLANNVASAEVAVLITGENGVGKERIADLIHRASRRASHPMIKVNAGAIPNDLIESELFGAEAGAFTGAHRQRRGHFEAAHRGTLFLDEIGNLSELGQMKILRALQSGEFQRLGSSKTIRVDVRVISATNSNLRQALESGSFRQDLYFRLNVIEIHIPPLRTRPADIAPLAETFTLKFARQAGKQVELAGDAIAYLESQDWPGNVRELANRVQRAVVVSSTGLIGPRDLAGPAGIGEPSPTHHDERLRIQRALDKHQGVVSRAARDLGLSRQALYRKLDKYGLAIRKSLRPSRKP